MLCCYASMLRLLFAALCSAPWRPLLHFTASSVFKTYQIDKKNLWRYDAFNINNHTYNSFPPPLAQTQLLLFGTISLVIPGFPFKFPAMSPLLLNHSPSVHAVIRAPDMQPHQNVLRYRLLSMSLSPMVKNATLQQMLPKLMRAGYIARTTFFPVIRRILIQLLTRRAAYHRRARKQPVINVSTTFDLPLWVSVHRVLTYKLWHGITLTPPVLREKPDKFAFGMIKFYAWLFDDSSNLPEFSFWYLYIS
ncbi:hypothetical protein DFJ58DRAFT_845443 [Suillus subalutaceus]|uniref:uncharacterized protein n=1 Tax=Suillus subalutaceus TaxID=48586 RepID=UPI001B87D793|nr:uncharacterized protein DFJ58DRAFT_845443 [Suillus subalutaceus]KAG1840180.1 hypothetical protein DFJ58DRAFT_845443 [Suillus subalutaceus]